MISSRKCTNCEIEKNNSEFVKNKYKKYGILTICKECFKYKYRKSKDERSDYYQKNKQKWNDYYIQNKDNITEYKKKYREENLEEIKIKQKEYVESNKDILKVKWKEYRENNKDRICKWFEDNSDYRNEYKQNYNSKEETRNKRNSIRKNRRQTDKIYQIKENIRSRISTSIRRSGHLKNSSTEVILGCTFDELKVYLESKFESWMNWENYGIYNGEFNYGWDIDHIIPLSSAKSEDGLTRLNHFTNLQPLCSKVNRDIKGSNFV